MEEKKTDQITPVYLDQRRDLNYQCVVSQQVKGYFRYHEA